MKRAVAGAEREQREGASGKWVAHWKMVHIVRPVWEKAGQDNQLGRTFPPLTYTQADADGLSLLEPAPRTIRGARDLLSVALQYGNAFGQGLQAAALKPADFFGNDDVLYLMEDMATGEIRLSILWEWLHKSASFTDDDAIGVKAGDRFTPELFARLLAEEYEKLRRAGNRDVHDVSKNTTLPIAREIVETYVMSDVKLPWYIDLLNINLENHDLAEARRAHPPAGGGVSQGRHADHGEPGLVSPATACRLRERHAVAAVSDAVALQILFVVAAVAAGLWLLHRLATVVLLLVLSTLFAYVIAPLVHIVPRPIRIGGRRRVAAARTRHRPRLPAASPARVWAGARARAAQA